jgi:MFS family permease
VFLITGGRLGDLFGRRRLFLLGVAGFTIASVLCGIAWSPVVLVVARILQGLTATAMAPQVLASRRYVILHVNRLSSSNSPWCGTMSKHAAYTSGWAFWSTAWKRTL